MIAIQPTQIFAWELGNELKVDDPQQAVSIMQGFVRDMACFVHQIDRYLRLVSSGFASTFHATNGQGHDPAALYDLTCADGKVAFDLGTVHGYNNQWSGPRAANWTEQRPELQRSSRSVRGLSLVSSAASALHCRGTGFHGNHSQAGDKCVDSSYTLGDEIWSGDSALVMAAAKTQPCSPPASRAVRPLTRR
ncbi:MAG: hypothetical protein U0559_16370 [Anaerolineae bacterium]